MKRQMIAGLAAIFTLSPLALPVLAATRTVQDQEPNDFQTQSAGGLSAGDQITLQGEIGGVVGGENQDPSDMYSLVVKGDGQVSFIVEKANGTVASSQTRLRVWTDRNGDGRITNEARRLDLESFRSRAISLAPGAYIVQITQSSKVPGKSVYFANVKSEF